MRIRPDSQRRKEERPLKVEKVEDINSLESEAGIIATLIKHPDFVFYSESLVPDHFTNKENKCVYMAIRNMARKGIFTTDPYNIVSYLDSAKATKEFAGTITVDKLNEFVDMSNVLARHTVEEYTLLTENVLNAAFRRNAYIKLRECQELCTEDSVEDIEQKIYDVIDDLMLQYSAKNEVPQYKDVIDECWDEIKSRQGNGYAGIPFKFPSLNEYATIEPGELFIFAAEAKQGKSIMLLNCAIDLLKRGFSVLYLDSELNTRLFTARVLAHLSGIEYKRLTTGSYSDEEAKRIYDAREWMKTKKFTHAYIPMFDMQSIYTAVKKIYHTQGIDVLIVDYFKGSGEGDAFNSYQELGRFVDLVKNRICGEMKIAGIGAAQATVSGKVADSAKIGRNASTIALIQDKTPEEIEADGIECGNKKLRVILNRNGMQHVGDEYINLRFDGNHILYEEAKQHIPQAPY